MATHGKPERFRGLLETMFGKTWSNKLLKGIEMMRNLVKSIN